MTDGLRPTAYQDKVLAFRQHCNILQAGGRGSGKSHGMCLDLVDHCRVFGRLASPLVTREQWSSLQEIQEKVFNLAVIAFGDASQNRAEGIIRLPTDGAIHFSNLMDDVSYRRIQGQTKTALYADEVGTYPLQVMKRLRLLRSNLRVPNGFRAHCHYTANPGGVAHGQIVKNYLNRAPAFTPFLDEGGEPWIWAGSTLKDNDHIDQAAYTRQLKAATVGDKGLEAAWIDGSFASYLGGMFDDLYDATVHVVRHGPPIELMDTIIGGDWGTASPACGTLLGILKQRWGYFLPGEIFVLGEACTCDPTDLSKGMGDAPVAVAQAFMSMATKCGVRKPECVMDNARGLASETVVGLFNGAGLPTTYPRAKDRKGHWAMLRELLHNAKQKEGKPGIYFVADACPHLLETFPEVPRNPRNRDDIMPDAVDHHLDSLVYGLRELKGGPKSHSGTVVGAW